MSSLGLRKENGSAVEVVEYFFTYMFYDGAVVVHTAHSGTTSIALDLVSWSVEQALVIQMYNTVKPLVTHKLKLDSALVLVYDTNGNSALFTTKVIELDYEAEYVAFARLKPIMTREVTTNAE